MAYIAGPNLQLPWYSSLDEDARFKKVLMVGFGVFIVLAILIQIFKAPPLTREERETLPPQLARVVLEKKEIPKPPPPPPPKPREEEKPEPVEEKPPEEKPPEPEPEPPKPKPVDRVAEAKEKAATSGLLQFQDDLADMRDALDIAKVDTGNLTRGDQAAAKVDRSVITSGAKSTSGGINTAALSRDTGGVALSGRETTKVESTLAERTGTGNEGGGEGGDRSGTRSDEEIRQMIDRNKAAIFAIYNRALRRDPTLQGKFTVQLTIEASGQISDVKIMASDLADPDLENKLIARIRLIAFNPTGGAQTIRNYTFDFLPY